ncbi:hypothetical protein OESDEN_21656, partial [Oesophagostomum dentatum]
MIPSLLESNYYEPNTRAFLVNAVYFKGQWATPFSPDNTRRETFYGIREERQEPLMKKNELKDCRYANRHGIQLLTLPYMGKSYEFVIFLPSQRGRFEEFRKNLTTQMMGELLKSARRLSSGIDVSRAILT